MGAIQAEGLVRRFDDVVAVDGVDLEVSEGEIYGFLGPNGAGKSTVVRMLCTLLLPTEGAARVGGLDVVDRANDVRFSIGVALQDAALDDRMTGTEILETQGRLFGLHKDEIATRIEELGPILEVDALDRLVGTYSGGMKRRLDLAAALMHNPEVLFLDEPTTGLDPPSRLRVWDEVRRLNRDLGMTVFLTTQYLEEADELADRIGIISDGRLVIEGTPEELKRTVGVGVVIAELDGDHERAMEVVDHVEGVTDVEQFGSEIFVTAADATRALSPVALALDRADISVRQLSLRTPTLDDVFLEVTGTRFERGEA